MEIGDRERDVLILIARGLSNQDIATTMFVGLSTAKTHLNRILTTLDLRSRAQAVVTACETGLDRPGEPLERFQAGSVAACAGTAATPCDLFVPNYWRPGCARSCARSRLLGVVLGSIRCGALLYRRSTATGA
jgi:DNA-binding CsgD family transcriptional regulator